MWDVRVGVVKAARDHLIPSQGKIHLRRPKWDLSLRTANSGLSRRFPFELSHGTVRMETFSNDLFPTSGPGLTAVRVGFLLDSCKENKRLESQSAGNVSSDLFCGKNNQKSLFLVRTNPEGALLAMEIAPTGMGATIPYF